MKTPLLDVKNLKTYFYTQEGVARAVDGMDFAIRAGKTLGVIGESGCGKSVSALSIMQLIASPPGKIIAGEIWFEGQNLLEKSPDDIRRIRGNEISMIFQEPMTSLNPVFTIGNQIAESIILHQQLDKNRARRKAIEMLERVGIPSPELRIDEYPHQMSGGMRQRAMIAMALSCEPKLLIADEPTTALDVTIQAQILELVKKIKTEIGMSVLMITHDLGVVAEVADDVVVAYAGKAVEYADVTTVFKHPRHPYTQALYNSIPRLTDTRKRRLEVITGMVPNPLAFPPAAGSIRAVNLHWTFAAPKPRNWKPSLPVTGSAVLNTIGKNANTSQPRTQKYERPTSNIEHRKLGSCLKNTPMNTSPHKLLSVRALKKYFPVRGGIFSKIVAQVKAVDGIGFDIDQGEVLGLVGESGCGKTTAGRVILGLMPPTEGTVRFDGTDLFALNKEALRDTRRHMQIIFQDPYASLNPRMTIADIVGEPLLVHNIARGAQKRQRVAHLLETVGLSAIHMHRYPHEFSGGQRQRIGIARALALNPKLIVCDEAVSALDVSIQAQVINLLEDLQAQFGFAYLFIAHDLSVIKHISSRVAVMYLGKIVETAATETLYRQPLHPYTQALLSAVPIPDPTLKRQRIVLEGDVPSPRNPPSGCHFRTRCPLVQPVCQRREPGLVEIEARHWAACHLIEARRAGTILKSADITSPDQS